MTACACIACVALLAASIAQADGIAIEKIETPVVTLLEDEIEYNALQSRDDGDSWMRHELSYGHALAERWFGEIEAVGVREPGAGTELEAFALELKHQLTEQGEYAADWGWMVELERETDDNVWEFSNLLIATRDWGRWTATANFAVIYEWGDLPDGKNRSELETRFAGQLKYRRGMDWAPALELHLAEDTRALGPVITGALRTGVRKKLLWEAGVLAGLDRDTPDLNLKFNIEYEF